MVICCLFYLRAFLGRGAGKRLSLELRLYIREGDVVVYPQNEYPVLNLFSDSCTPPLLVLSIAGEV